MKLGYTFHDDICETLIFLDGIISFEVYFLEFIARLFLVGQPSSPLGTFPVVVWVLDLTSVQTEDPIQLFIIFTRLFSLTSF